MILWRVDNGWNNTDHREFLLMNAGEVNQLPTDCAPGSIARTYDWSSYYTLNEKGVWVAAVFSVNEGE